MEPDQRKSILSDGFKYGNLGQEGVDRTIEMAVKIASSKMSVSQIKKSLDTTEMDILKEYYSKVETIKGIFKWAISFEKKAFEKSLTKPNDLDIELKGSLALMLDFFKINRKDFFELYK